MPIIVPSIFNVNHTAQAARVLLNSSVFTSKEELPDPHRKRGLPDAPLQETVFSGPGKFFSDFSCCGGPNHLFEEEICEAPDGRRNYLSPMQDLDSRQCFSLHASCFSPIHHRLLISFALV